MATDGKLVRIYNKKLLASEQIRDNFLYYLRDLTESTVASIMRSAGSFDAICSVAAELNGNSVNIAAGSDPVWGTDGIGHIFYAVGATEYLQDVAIPPEADVAYHIGLRRALVESDIESNAQTGALEYASFTEMIGYEGTPDAVELINGGTQLKITVDSVLEAGHDHSGRSVRVWLKPIENGGPGPKGTLADDHIVTATVQYASSSNYIEVSLLGQTAASETASDYKIMLVGPRVTRVADVDLRTEEGTLFLAAITAKAAGQTVIVDTTDQPVIYNTLALLGQITQTISGNLKVRVHAYAAEANSDVQISVWNGSTYPFTVDKIGDVVAHDVTVRNLTVTGTETVEINQSTTGDVTIGAVGDTTHILTIYNKLHIGPNTNLQFGVTADGYASVPGNKIVWASTKHNIEMSVAANGTVNDLIIGRNDDTLASSKVIFKNAGSTSKLIDVEVQGGVQIGLTGYNSANSQLLTFVSGTSGATIWKLGTVADVFQLNGNSASARSVEVMNGGGGAANLIVKNNITAGSAGVAGAITAVDGNLATNRNLAMTGATPTIDASGGALLVKDANVTVAIPLSGSASADKTLPSGVTTLIGGINYPNTTLGYHRSNCVLGGLVCSINGSGRVDYTLGTAWIGGTRISKAAGSVTGLTTTGWYWIYIDSAGTVAATTTEAVAWATGNVPLYEVYSAAGTLSKPRNIKRGYTRLGNSKRLIVGSDGDADFTDLWGALDYVKNVITNGAGVEIVLQGTGCGGPWIDTYGFTTAHNGLKITGGGSAGPHLTHGAATGAVAHAMFGFGSGVTDITFDNVDFSFNYGAGPSGMWSFFQATTLLADITIKNCTFSSTSVQGFTRVLDVAAGVTVSGLTFDNNTITAVGTDGSTAVRDSNGFLIYTNLTGKIINSSVRNNKATENWKENATALNSRFIYVAAEDLEIANNKFTNLASGTSSNFSIHVVCSEGGIQIHDNEMIATGCSIHLSGPVNASKPNAISDNVISNGRAGDGTNPSVGIQVTAVHASVSGNDVRMSGNYSLGVKIIGSTAPTCSVSGNTLYGSLTASNCYGILMSACLGASVNGNMVATGNAADSYGVSLEGVCIGLNVTGNTFMTTGNGPSRMLVTTSTTRSIIAMNFGTLTGTAGTGCITTPNVV